MIREITMRRSGGSVSVTIPKDMADRLHIGAGDRVFAIETDRGILLTPYDPDYDRAMQMYDRGAKQYRNAMRELSK